MTDQPKPEEFQVPVKLFDLGQIMRRAGALAASARGYHGAVSCAACARRLWA